MVVGGDKSPGRGFIYYIINTQLLALSGAKSPPWKEKYST